MSREKKKYNREQLAKADPDQLTFTSNGAVLQKRKRVVVKTNSLDLLRIVFCPFCLKENPIQRFLVSGKKGISRSRALCPECHIGMMMHTILRKWDAVYYAEWVFNYRKSGFWQKIKIEEWKKMLYEKGWAHDFWEHYRMLKGATPEDEEESYAEHMNRLGEEAAREWTSVGEDPNS